MNVYSDLISSSKHDLEEEQIEPFATQDVNYYQTNQNMINKLNEEGFFAREESEDDFQVCKIVHENHYPITLSLRVILKISNRKENASLITLKLIDLFYQKGNEEMVERLLLKFLSEKVFNKFSFEEIKKTVYEQKPIESIKEILTTGGIIFEDQELLPYRVESGRTVNESLSLITYNEIDPLGDYEISESKEYKKYEGKLDQNPEKGHDYSLDMISERYTMHDGETTASSPEE